MSENVLQPDLDALHQSAIDVITHVSNVMEKGVALLREHDRLLAENHSDNRLVSEIKAIEQDLRYVKSDLEKVKQRELTMTIVAPTSAGKSMIINTIAGQELLPSRKTPMTILPTEIVFSKNVTHAKLILSETLMSHLLEVWRQLHDHIQQIGEKETVDRAINASFICEDLVNKIAKDSTPVINAESIGSQLIESNLTTINDVFRLANILGFPTNFLSSLTQIPRIEAPFHAKLSSLQSLSKLVLVDTPGITEYNSSNLTDIVKDRLKASTLILVVVDYNTIGQKNPNEVKMLIDEIATVKGRDLIYIAVNKIDERNDNNPKHLAKAKILDIVKNQYQIADPEHRVFELSGIQAFFAVNFWHEFSQPKFVPLLNMPTVQALGSKYHSYSWKKKQSIIDELEIQEMVEEFWRDSKFDLFINTAIFPLLGEAKPSSIYIKAALKDTSGRLSDFQSCLQILKGILDHSLQETENDIKWIEADLKEIKMLGCSGEYFSDYYNKETLLSKGLFLIWKSREDKIYGDQPLIKIKINALYDVIMSLIPQFKTKLNNLSPEKMIASVSLTSEYKFYLENLLQHKQKMTTVYSIIADKYCGLLENITNTEVNLNFLEKYIVNL